MSAEKKPSVLVCVTGQYDCDRLIEAGFDQAKELSCELHVFCVQKPSVDMAYFSDEIEYLYRTAKRLGADMTVMFSDNAPKCTADFARRINAKHLITGVPDDRPNGFVLTLHEFLPRAQIIMVTKEGEKLSYSLIATKRAFA
ncbi:hypothetical protein [Ruminococcus sp.]|uniref:hypothetical protein n=1 Tax=Ruminococcus sp. TaxID=41978 RepID=UPI0038693CAA